MWITNNVTDMRNNFCHCSSLLSLLSLPDISIWNTTNVTEMSGMFYKYHYLISLNGILIM